MKSPVLTLAALLAAGTLSPVFAQEKQQLPAVQQPLHAQTPSGAVTNSNANVPTTTPDPSSEAAAVAGQLNRAVPAVPYTPEPIASPVKRVGTSTDVEAAIVEALNADPSLKGAKITVAAEKEAVLLTGVSMTKAQRKKAMEIASATAGEGNVVNAILATEA